MPESIHALETRLKILANKLVHNAITYHGKDIQAFESKDELYQQLWDCSNSGDGDRAFTLAFRLMAWNDAPTNSNNLS